MKGFALAFGILSFSMTGSLPLLVAAAEPAPTVVAIPPSKPGYWHDKRLDQPVTFPAPAPSVPRKVGVYSRPLAQDEGSGDPDAPPTIIRLVGGTEIGVPEFEAAIRQKTGVTLLLAGEWSRQRLAVSRAEVPVRTIMDDMAAIFGARWWPQGKDTWVLARGPNEATWVAQPEAERTAAMRATATRLLKTLSPGEWRALTEGATLTPQSLSPPARQAIIESLRLSYYDPKAQWQNVPSAAALNGKGITLSLHGSGREACLWLNSHGNTGRFTCGIPFYNANSGQLEYGVRPPR